MLLNLVVDILTIMLIRASETGFIKGMCLDACPGGVIILQYTGDTILFSKSDEQLATNLKWVLTCFKQVSVMRINSSISEIMLVGLNMKIM
jgi:hypothetical protein